MLLVSSLHSSVLLCGVGTGRLIVGLGLTIGVHTPIDNSWYLLPIRRVIMDAYEDEGFIAQQALAKAKVIT